MSLFATRKATDYIVVHTTATPEGKDFTRADIDRMHRQRGFTGIGYHYLIRLDGTVEAGRPEHTVGAHVAGHNHNSVSLSYVGGVDAKGKSKDTRTPAQTAAMIKLIRELLTRYPKAQVLGHRDFPGVAKDCPCFDTRKWWASVQTEPAKAASSKHIVTAGETLYGVARRYGTSPQALAVANGISATAFLKIGQVLTIPA